MRETALVMSTADVPTVTDNAPIVRDKSVHTLDDLRRRWESEVAVMLAKLTLGKYFRADIDDHAAPAQGWMHR